MSRDQHRERMLRFAVWFHKWLHWSKVTLLSVCSAPWSISGYILYRSWLCSFSEVVCKQSTYLRADVICRLHVANVSLLAKKGRKREARLVSAHIINLCYYSMPWTRCSRKLTKIPQPSHGQLENTTCCLFLPQINKSVQYVHHRMFGYRMLIKSVILD